MSFVRFVCYFFLIATRYSDSTAALDKRIINGTTANNGQYPYQVSVRTITNYHFCGGSILNTKWVLTAATCLQVTANFIVVVGTNSLLSGGTIHQVATYKKHPSFNPATMIYDAGIIKTVKSIVYSSTVAPIVLSFVPPLVCTVGVVTGWGYTSYPSIILSNQLRALNTLLISEIECQHRYLTLNFTLQWTQMCTFKRQTGFCLGDAGGPLVLGNTQFGIVSLTILCATDYPDIYTKTSSIYNWVISNT